MRLPMRVRLIEGIPETASRRDRMSAARSALVNVGFGRKRTTWEIMSAIGNQQSAIRSN
jgi:hypothetical protein